MHQLALLSGQRTGFGGLGLSRARVPIARDRLISSKLGTMPIRQSSVDEDQREAARGFWCGADPQRRLGARRRLTWIVLT